MAGRSFIIDLPYSEALTLKVNKSLHHRSVFLLYISFKWIRLS